MPYIQVAAAVHFDFSGYTPLCLYGWPHQTTPAPLARNREGVTNLVTPLESVNGGLKAHAGGAGLKIEWEDPGSTISPGKE
jgi:zeaxanthin glucosyltransferase